MVKGIPPTQPTDDTRQDDNNLGQSDDAQQNNFPSFDKPVAPVKKDLPQAPKAFGSFAKRPSFGAPSNQGNQTGGFMDDGFDDGFGDGFGSGKSDMFGGSSFGGGFGAGGGFGGGGGMSREDRTKMIKKSYKEVLGREAQTRDINYYKYGTQNEDQVKNQLMKSDEHKEVIKKGRKFDEISSELEETKTKLKAAESKINDSQQEVNTLKTFLDQKNAEITRLRASNTSLTSAVVSNYPNFGQNFAPSSTPQPSVTPQTYTPAPPSQPEQAYQAPSEPQNPATFMPKPAEVLESPDSSTYTPPANPTVTPGTTQQEPKKDIIDRITSLFF